MRTPQVAELPSDLRSSRIFRVCRGPAVLCDGPHACDCAFLRMRLLAEYVTTSDRLLAFFAGPPWRWKTLMHDSGLAPHPNAVPHECVRDRDLLP